MPVQPCPACGASPRQLPFTSQLAAVTYYRCPKCAHVWAIRKDDPTHIQHVTPLVVRKSAS
jgi:hypothetical protein